MFWREVSKGRNREQRRRAGSVLRAVLSVRGINVLGEGEVRWSSPPDYFSSGRTAGQTSTE